MKKNILNKIKCYPQTKKTDNASTDVRNNKYTKCQNASERLQNSSVVPRPSYCLGYPKFSQTQLNFLKTNVKRLKINFWTSPGYNHITVNFVKWTCALYSKVVLNIRISPKAVQKRFTGLTSATCTDELSLLNTLLVKEIILRWIIIEFVVIAFIWNSKHCSLNCCWPVEPGV